MSPTALHARQRHLDRPAQASQPGGDHVDVAGVVDDLAVVPLAERQSDRDAHVRHPVVDVCGR
jgi:hypothetical protein